MRGTSRRVNRPQPVHIAKSLGGKTVAGCTFHIDVRPFGPLSRDWKAVTCRSCLNLKEKIDGPQRA